MKKPALLAVALVSGLIGFGIGRWSIKPPPPSGAELDPMLSQWLELKKTIPSCANETLSEGASPDGLWKAVVFQRDCGATTGFSTQVSILKRGESLPNAPGNLFVADRLSGEVQARWKSNAALRLSVPSEARIFKQERRFGKIEVEYPARRQP